MSRWNSGCELSLVRVEDGENPILDHAEVCVAAWPDEEVGAVVSEPELPDRGRHVQRAEGVVDTRIQFHGGFHLIVTLGWIIVLEVAVDWRGVV
ncbi:MAG: hypothetical protein P8J32_02535 [bacterium]|nr:hypothetical protein [bacterium]